ncbi:hypothetical protein M409DRAFT_29149 [Zasmidium cellare ATCC 36951]|uniref:DUF7918 domain-containing protein n=1 Tax=Zasmidium cellare ATCC 36951 TaxID=1080233 RepID=A0A6A6BZS0_ZASCE|nr:uncharacterized protein M409DRAFT_29149 [Zasmidium cellare ATCC 36951]KAF2160294.1 hypothetical protein M409DRAFT_29149 [Zasmidium cellare ATCC 36951]
MAILKSLHGVEVTITVDNEPLQEYEPKEGTDPYDTVTRYVQTQPDQNFEIKIVTNQGSTRGAGLKYEVMIDANIADSTVVLSEQCAHDSMIWRFRESQLEEDEYWKEPHEVLKNLGLIEVRVYHLSNIELKESDPASYDLRNARDLISHKARRKGVSHTVSASIDAIEKEVDELQVHLSLSGLADGGIIPRPPPPPALEDRDAATLTVEDIAELQRQLKVEKDEKYALKIKDEIKQEDREAYSRPMRSGRPSGRREYVELD